VFLGFNQSQNSNCSAGITEFEESRNLLREEVARPGANQPTSAEVNSVIPSIP